MNILSHTLKEVRQTLLLELHFILSFQVKYTVYSIHPSYPLKGNYTLLLYCSHNCWYMTCIWVIFWSYWSVWKFTLAEFSALPHPWQGRQVYYVIYCTFYYASVMSVISRQLVAHFSLEQTRSIPIMSGPFKLMKCLWNKRCQKWWWLTCCFSEVNLIVHTKTWT